MQSSVITPFDIFFFVFNLIPLKNMKMDTLLSSLSFEGHLFIIFLICLASCRKNFSSCFNQQFCLSLLFNFSGDYQERVLSVLPFFHIYGLNVILHSTLFYGMQMISIPKFTPELYIECVLKYKVYFNFISES